LGKKIAYNDMRIFLLRLADTIIQQKDYLNELDAACGDGDLGVGMYIGFRNVRKTVEQEEKDEEDIGALLKATGRSILSSVGGASGALFGTLFMEAGKVTSGKSQIDLKDISIMFWASSERIFQRTGSKLGDKTLIDALEPAARSLREAAQQDLELTQALKMAADAARRGAESTKFLIAKQGKARYLGEQTLGHVDPGAEVTRLIFETLLATCQVTNSRENSQTE